jgi:pyruvate,water dikinase
MLIQDLFKHWTYQVFLPGEVVREKYEDFKSLLAQDIRAHELMADIEEIYYQRKRVDSQVVEKKYHKLARCVSLMVTKLSKISPVRYHSLNDYYKKFDFYIKYLLAPEIVSFSPPFVVDINFDNNDVDSDNPLFVGGKANNLQLIHMALDIQIPKGFVVTTNAFRYFLEYNNLSKIINRQLAQIDITRTKELEQVSKNLIQYIKDATVPAEIEDIIRVYLGNIQSGSEEDLILAVRSSAVAEDGICSFAGQYKSVLNISLKNVINAYKEVVASKYSVNALYYRITKGMSDTDTPMAVLCMEMINAKTSGVMYTRNIENLSSKELSIYSVKGACEPLVSGTTSAETIRVSRESGKIISSDSKQFSLEQKIAEELVKTGLKIENYFGQTQDIEWCQDQNDNLYILQARPLSKSLLRETYSEPDGKSDKVLQNFGKDNPILLKGGSMASAGMGSGQVFLLRQLSQLDQVPGNTILVTKYPLPELVTIIEKLTAIVTDTGSAAGHFASVAREFSTPMLVNTGNATKILKHGDLVTIHAGLETVFQGKVAMEDGFQAAQDTESDPFLKTPFTKTLNSVMKFISPLRLIDPSSDEFTPEGCRSFHDIIRFAHEKAVQEMFRHGRRKGSRKKGAIKLVSDIPMLFYILDVGEGIRQQIPDSKEVHVDDVICSPFKAVYKGLSHPDIKWEQVSNYDWAAYDDIVMAGGIISPYDAQFGSYAIIAKDYLNINLRFGYHFVILDTFCGEITENNYILFRFSGGGGNPTGRALRVDFLVNVLIGLGFMVQTKGEMVDGQLKHLDFEQMKGKLDWVGRLLGATRLMDMHLKEGMDIKFFVGKFLDGQYDFKDY